MCRASAFQSGDRHQSHVCVVCAWLNVGELPRFDNQPQHLAALLLLSFLLSNSYFLLCFVGFIVWLDLLFLEQATECQTNQHAQSDSARRPFAVGKSGSRVSAEMRRIKNERKAECAPNKEINSEDDIYCAEPKWRTSEISLEPNPQQQYDGQNGRGGVQENENRVVVLHYVRSNEK